MSTEFPDDDPLATRLRDALSSEAAMVQPSDDGLGEIRSGIAAQPDRRWWQQPWMPAAAAAVVLALMAGGFAIAANNKGNGDDGSDSTVAAGSSTSPAATPTSSSASVEPEPSDPPMTGTPIPIEGDVYVYYVHDDGQGPRLYREQRPNPGGAGAPAALSVMLSEPPLDPDYSSPWPESTTVDDYSTAGDTATVDLSDFPSVGAAAETAAVQQLVYTVTANDKAVTKVRLLVDGKAPASGHSDWSKPVARAPMADVQGWIWLLSPTEGATVSSPVAITGFGTAFEGTISWEVRKGGSNGPTLAEGTTQGGSNGEFAEFSDSVDLDPGSYELRAFEASAEDGSPIHVDTKSFTVR